MTTTVVVVPFTASLDAAANRAAAVGAVEDAAARGAGLVVLPEYAARFDPRGVGPEHAEPLDGPFLTALRDAARRTGVAVVAGTVTPGATADRAVNLVAVVAPDGALAAAYRKVHLYDAFGQRESDRFEPGDPAQPAPVVDLGGLRLGVLTCYDLRFPESARRLVDAGATVLVVPAAWAAGERKADQWRTLLRARAIEDVCWVVAAAQHGRGVVGTSLVVDPLGDVVAESDPADPRPVAASLDAGAVTAARERNPSLANRRYAVVPLDTAASQTAP